jgi:hypothetical protein
VFHQLFVKGRRVRPPHDDLQDNGVRCWFAPEDMKIGAKVRDTIDDAIRLRDKVLLVLSEASIASDWVEDEVDKAFEEERQRGDVVLFSSLERHIRMGSSEVTANPPSCLCSLLDLCTPLGRTP